MSKKQTAVDINVELPVIGLALDKILVDESRNLRRFNPDPKRVMELADSIKANKLINPVLVRLLDTPIPGHEEATHILVAGYQRMKALRYLNDNGFKVETVSASELPAEMESQEVKEGEEAKTNVNSAQSKLLNLKENLERSEISYIDSAFAIKELMESGMTQADIAKEFKKSGAWVSYVVKLLTLRADVQKKIHEGKVTWRVARTLPDLTPEEQDEAIAAIDAGDKKAAAASVKKSKASKGRKNKRGRKAAEDSTENKNISSKAAILELEEMVVELKAEPEEKRGKTEQAAVDYAVQLYKDVVKYLSGGIGVKALHNRVMKGV